MPTLSQGRILLALHRGAVIRAEHVNHPPSSVRRSYRLTPGNQVIQEQMVQKLLNERLIRAQSDGLFADGPAQSYVLFPPSEGGA